MKTLETPTDQTHLLNYGFDSPFGSVTRIHVQFNKQTGEVESLKASGNRDEDMFADVTDRLRPAQIATLKNSARQRYKEQYGYLPENQPANA
jgi:hypothetical protein